MQKKIFIPVVSLLILFLWGNCLAKTFTVIDQAGRQVDVKQPVNRVVTTFIPATLFALCSGLGDKLVGTSTKDGTASLYEVLIDQTNPPALVGNRSSGINLETISSLKPDLIIMYGQKDGVRLADRLTSMGMSAIVIMPESMNDMIQTLDLIGTASGKKAHTDSVIRTIQQIRAMMENKLSGADRHKVYYAGSNLFSTVSGDMLQSEMIMLAGGINVSREASGFFINISREQLLSWNPGYIIASERLSHDAEKKMASPQLSMIQAVKQKHFYRIPSGTYWDFPSPLAMAGILWMAGKIHPMRFSQKTIRSEIDRLYDTLFGMDFSMKYPLVVGKI